MYRQVLSGSLFIVGTAVGAGMLGIPLVTSSAGFLPALFISGLIAIFMAITGLLLLEAVLAAPDGSNILSIAHLSFGKMGQVLSGIPFLFLYYCLLCAYFTAASSLMLDGWQAIFGYSLPAFGANIAFLMIFGSILSFGMKWIERFNLFAILLMAVSYFFVLYLGSAEISFTRLGKANMQASFWATPILFSAFGYHNIIPSLTAYFKKDKAVMQKAICTGCFCVFLIYALWQCVILGAVPENILHAAKNEPPSYLISYLQQKGTIWGYLLSFFAFFAIVTSFFGVSISMMDFLGEALGKKQIGKDRFLIASLTLAPPLMVSAVDPRIFIRALELAGGFGESILNGILPVLFVFFAKTKIASKGLLHHKGFLLLCFLFALSVFFLEIVGIMSG